MTSSGKCQYSLSWQRQHSRCLKLPFPRPLETSRGCQQDKAQNYPQNRLRGKDIIQGVEKLVISGEHNQRNFATVTQQYLLRQTSSKPSIKVRWSLRDTTLARGGGHDGTEPIGIERDTGIGYSTIFWHQICIPARLICPILKPSVVKGGTNGRPEHGSIFRSMADQGYALANSLHRHKWVGTAAQEPRRAPDPPSSIH